MEVGSRVFVEIRKPPTITITDISKEATAGETARTQYSVPVSPPRRQNPLRPPPHTPLLVGLAPPPPHIATEPSSRFDGEVPFNTVTEANQWRRGLFTTILIEKLNSLERLEHRPRSIRSWKNV